MQALSKKKTGDICTIKWMFGIPDVLDFLRSRKIKEGKIGRASCRERV